jgi:hypothetical protein
MATSFPLAIEDVIRAPLPKTRMPYLLLPDAVTDVIDAEVPERSNTTP